MKKISLLLLISIITGCGGRMLNYDSSKNSQQELSKDEANCRLAAYNHIDQFGYPSIDWINNCMASKGWYRERAQR